MKYEYFISYAHDNGFGYSGVTLEQKIDGYELLLEIAKKITKSKCWQGYREKGILVHYWRECKLV